MAKVRVTESSLENIADAIRAKLGVATEYKPGEMAAAIASIPTGGSAVLEHLSVTQNGTYTPGAGVDGFDQVTVNVSGGGGHFDGDLITLLTEDQGSRWIDTGYDVSNVTDFLFFKYLSGQADSYAPVYKAKSDIAVYTGGADVYTPIFTVTKPFNVRIFNNTLWVSFNGVGSNTNGALSYTGGNFADFMSTV